MTPATSAAWPAVELAISDVATGAWWNGNDWQAGRHPRASHAGIARRRHHDVGLQLRPAGTGHLPRGGDRGGRGGQRPGGGPVGHLRLRGCGGPTGTVSAPTSGAVLNSTPISVAGSAADDVGVTGVALAITDASTGGSWNGTAWQSTATTVPAVLAVPGDHHHGLVVCVLATHARVVPGGRHRSGRGRQHRPGRAVERLHAERLPDGHGPHARRPRRPAWPWAPT